ncbi:MAG TPA: acyl-CoA dehydrogenase family protein [Candidatus Cybelea sp.]|nr:acyl-CoA dehydrogenase family protein [Candidatus Cybelea sp.]
MTMDRQALAGGHGAAGARHLALVESVLPVIAANAERADRERRLTAEMVAALHGAKLYRMLLPKPFDGLEIDPLTFVQVIEAIAKVDASTAWCLCQNAVCAMTSAFIAPETATRIFAREHTAVLAWGPGPKARAVAVDGGYRIDGTFTFASGGRQATWLGGFCPIVGADGQFSRDADGAVIGRTMLFPASSATFEDVWEVIGLRGTASDSFTVTGLFVPQDCTVARDDQAERRYGGQLYALPTNSMFACGFACLSLGLARSLLDAFVGLAGDKTPRGSRQVLRDNAVVHAEVAEAEARLRAARSYILGTLGDIWAQAQRDGARGLTLDQRMTIRLAATFTIQQAVQVADMAYHAAGATAIFAGQPFERRFRDMHTVAQQVQGRRAHFETVGRFMFGLEPDKTFI